jgi:hypothetical protein
MLEIYNEEYKDLLARKAAQKKHNVRAAGEGGGKGKEGGAGASYPGIVHTPHTALCI